MSVSPQSKTSELNGRLWGARARDWANLQEPIARPFYEAVLDRTHVQVGARCLDVGCGAGLAAQLAAQRGARVAGIDASAALLEIARERVPAGDFRRGDLEALPFEDATFDIVTGFNSFQFAGNPIAALSQARRVAKTGGTIAIVTWGNPEGMEAAAVVASLRPLLPTPPPGAPGPFALSDESALRAFASDAGLEPIEIFDVPTPFAYPNEATALRALGSSGVAERARENTSDQAVTEAHAAAIAPFRRPDGSYRIMASFRCLLAKPSR
jgi:SAM-dependent methyltransferase